MGFALVGWRCPGCGFTSMFGQNYRASPSWMSHLRQLYLADSNFLSCQGSWHLQSSLRHHIRLLWTGDKSGFPCVGCHWGGKQASAFLFFCQLFSLDLCYVVCSFATLFGGCILNFFLQNVRKIAFRPKEPALAESLAIFFFNLYLRRT